MVASSCRDSIPAEASFVVRAWQASSREWESCMPATLDWRRTGLCLALACLAFTWLTPPIGLADEEPAIAKHENWVTSIAWHGSTMATGGGQSLQFRPGEVKLWNADTGEHVADYEGATSNVWSVAISPCGQYLVGSGYDGKIWVWDVESKELKQTLEKHKGWVRTIAFSPDGSQLTSGGEDGMVVVWNSGSWEEERSFTAHEAAVYQLVFAPMDRSSPPPRSTSPSNFGVGFPIRKKR
jgi:WD40 repeat protein